MTFPAQAGQPTYTGIMIPEIWSTKLIEKYYDTTILSKISNTNYEGEIRNQGDKVIIRTNPTLEINDYEIGMTLINQRPVGTVIELLIDKGLYWSAIIDDVVEKQQDIDQMNMWATDAAEQLKIKLDTRVLAAIVPDISADNKGSTAGVRSNDIDLGVTGAPLAIDSTNILESILNAGQVLDEQNAPETGRFMVLPFWATNQLKQSDLKAAYLTGDNTTPLRNGMVGTVDRFTIYNSNLLPTYIDGADTTTHFLFGVDYGLTFATQLTKTESLRAESTFGNIMRGLMVYGHEVIKPEALGAIYAVKAA
jgi:hypothetical protein